MTTKNKKLCEILGRLNENGSAILNGKIVLGNFAVELRCGGFFEPRTKFEGSISITKTDKGYRIRAGKTDTTIFTDKNWTLYQKPVFHYSTRLRRALRTEPHLMLYTEKEKSNSDKYQFGILYDANPEVQA